MLNLFHTLFDIYGEQHWWPSRSGTRWEIAAGAVLVQNTAWANVEKALDNLEAAGLMSPKGILSVPVDALREIIRPAGFFKQKSVYLKAVAEFFLAHEKAFLKSKDLPAMRRQLLAVKGVGRETADDILLYAFKKPVFIIDAYTRRVAGRHLGLDAGLPYEALQKLFMDALPSDAELYGEYHALILALGKDSCQKSGCGEVCQRLPGKHSKRSS
jgi:endonuclease-3 related protein